MKLFSIRAKAIDCLDLSAFGENLFSEPGVSAQAKDGVGGRPLVGKTWLLPGRDDLFIAVKRGDVGHIVRQIVLQADKDVVERKRLWVRRRGRFLCETDRSQ